MLDLWQKRAVIWCFYGNVIHIKTVFVLCHQCKEFGVVHGRMAQFVILIQKG